METRPNADDNHPVVFVAWCTAAMAERLRAEAASRAFPCQVLHQKDATIPALGYKPVSEINPRRMELLKLFVNHDADGLPVPEATSRYENARAVLRALEGVTDRQWLHIAEVTSLVHEWARAMSLSVCCDALHDLCMAGLVAQMPSMPSKVSLNTVECLQSVCADPQAVLRALRAWGTSTRTRLVKDIGIGVDRIQGALAILRLDGLAEVNGGFWSAVGGPSPQSLRDIIALHKIDGANKSVRIGFCLQALPLVRRLLTASPAGLQRGTIEKALERAMGPDVATQVIVNDLVTAKRIRWTSPRGPTSLRHRLKLAPERAVKKAKGTKS